MRKKILIFGAGAIGSHLGYCLQYSNFIIHFICRGQHYEQIKKSGLQIKIYQNQKLLIKKKIIESDNIKFLNKIPYDQSYDYIFLTSKLNENIGNIANKINKLVTKKTMIIPQCTHLPFWIDSKIYKEKNLKKKDVNLHYIKKFPEKNIIGMTTWLSGLIEKPGVIKIKHVQRGYPMKEVHKKGFQSCNYLRKSIRKHCLSPNIKNLKSEMFIKSINALAFNMIALKNNQNNLQLKRDQNSINQIENIMKEGDQFLKKKKIPIIQSIKDRISQTLSSNKHTMSMLSDFRRGKKIELEYIWSTYFNFMTQNHINIDFSHNIYKNILKIIK